MRRTSLFRNSSPTSGRVFTSLSGGSTLGDSRPSAWARSGGTSRARPGPRSTWDLRNFLAGRCMRAHSVSTLSTGATLSFSLCVCGEAHA